MSALQVATTLPDCLSDVSAGVAMHFPSKEVQLKTAISAARATTTTPVAETEFCIGGPCLTSSQTLPSGTVFSKDLIWPSPRPPETTSTLVATQKAVARRSTRRLSSAI